MCLSSCFRIRIAVAVRGQGPHRMTVDLAPGPVIEIDSTGGSLDRLQVSCASRLRTRPCAWTGTVDYLPLLSDSYAHQDVSVALPLTTGWFLPDFIRESETLRRTARLRKLRACTDVNRK